MRYLLEISYLGTDYAGWQSQPNANTIQAEIEKALSTLLKAPTAILGSSRTDAGVHAKQQFASFDVEKEINSEALTYKLNQLLPKNIAIINITEVSSDFHPRFAATSRAYEYCISIKKSPFIGHTTYVFTVPLQIELMNQAASILLKHTDFQCFSKVHTDVFTYNCSIEYAYWQQTENELIFKIKANRFLRGMVRAIVGTLLEVGLARLNIDDFEKIILSKNRNKAGRAVPAQGLCLVEVAY